LDCAPCASYAATGTAHEPLILFFLSSHGIILLVLFLRNDFSSSEKVRMYYMPLQLEDFEIRKTFQYFGLPVNFDSVVESFSDFFKNINFFINFSQK
jgi:hypothetical protein